MARERKAPPLGKKRDQIPTTVKGKEQAQKLFS